MAGRSFQYFVGALEFSYLLFELFDPLGFRGGYRGRIPVVDVGLAYPGAHRLHPVAKLTGHPRHGALLGTQLGPQGADHPHGSGLLLRAVATRRGLPRRLFLRHTCILVSKVRSLRDFQFVSVSNCVKISAGVVKDRSRAVIEFAFDPGELAATVP